MEEARIEYIDKKIEETISNRYTDAANTLNNSIQIIEESLETDYQRGIIYGKLLVAFANFIRSDCEHVFEFLMDSYEYFKQNSLEKGLLITLNTLGGYYDNQGDYEKALVYLHEGILASKKLNFKDGEADILSSMGKVYLRIKNYDKAIQSLMSSLEIRKEINLPQAQASSLNLLGRAYTLKKEFDTAVAFYDQSIKIRKEIDDYHGMVWSNIGLATMYESKNEPEKSILFYKKAFDSKEKLNDSILEFHITKGLGNIYLMQGDYKLAEQQITPLISIAESTKSKPLLYQAYELTASYYEKTSDFEKAFRNYKKYIELKEEVLNTETQNRILNKQTEFEILNTKKEEEISKLRNLISNK